MDDLKFLDRYGWKRRDEISKMEDGPEKEDALRDWNEKRKEYFKSIDDEYAIVAQEIKEWEEKRETIFDIVGLLIKKKESEIANNEN